MIGTLLQINGQTIPNIKSYKVGNNKLWADAERNMNGDVRATMIGVFPKIELEIGGILTSAIVANLCSLLDQSYFSVTFYDPKTRTTRTAQYYASDYTVELSDKYRELYEPFSVNLIPVSKR
jgi:hypothetical protein